MTNLAIRNCDLTIQIVLKRPSGELAMLHVCVPEQEKLRYIKMIEQSKREVRETQEGLYSTQVQGKLTGKAAGGQGGRKVRSFLDKLRTSEKESEGTGQQGRED